MRLFRLILPLAAALLATAPSAQSRDLGNMSSTEIRFCQAAHTLVKRGLLIPCGDEGAKQLRFVSMRPDIFVVHPQIRQTIPAPELTRMLRVVLENTSDEIIAAEQQLYAVVGLLAASGLTHA